MYIREITGSSGLCVTGEVTATVQNTTTTPLYITQDIRQYAGGGPLWVTGQFGNFAGNATEDNAGIGVTGTNAFRPVYIDNANVNPNGYAKGLFVTGEAQNPIYIHDGGNSITVDNTSGTPLYINNASGSSALFVQPPSGSTAFDVSIVNQAHPQGDPLYVAEDYQRSNPYLVQTNKTVFVTGNATSINSSSYTSHQFGRYAIKAPETNNATIWIAHNSGSARSSGEYAFPIHPGDSLDIKTTPIDTWYGICEGTGYVGRAQVDAHANNSLYLFSD